MVGQCEIPQTGDSVSYPKTHKTTEMQKDAVTSAEWGESNCALCSRIILNSSPPHPARMQLLLEFEICERRDLLLQTCKHLFSTEFLRRPTPSGVSRRRGLTRSAGGPASGKMLSISCQQWPVGLPSHGTSNQGIISSRVWLRDHTGPPLSQAAWGLIVAAPLGKDEPSRLRSGKERPFSLPRAGELYRDELGGTRWGHGLDLERGSPSSKPPSPSSRVDLPSPPLFNKAWALVIILGRWRWGQPVKGVGVTPEERMVGMTEKKKQIREKIKSRSSPFTRLKALKRIRSDRAWGLLSSLAIRLSWWRERHEWQGSRPSLGLPQREGVFSPTPPLSSSPFRVSEMQLKYLSKKTAQSPMPNLNHSGWWDWEGEGRVGGKNTHTPHTLTHTFFSRFIFTLLYEPKIQGRHGRFICAN